MREVVVEVLTAHEGKSLDLARKGDLLHIPKYLFHKSYVPTSKVEIEYSKRGKLLSLNATPASEYILAVRPASAGVLAHLGLSPYRLRRCGQCLGGLHRLRRRDAETG